MTTLIVFVTINLYITIGYFTVKLAADKLNFDEDSSIASGIFWPVALIMCVGYGSVLLNVKLIHVIGKTIETVASLPRRFRERSKSPKIPKAKTVSK